MSCFLKIFLIGMIDKCRKGGELIAVRHGLIFNDKMIKPTVRFLNELIGLYNQHKVNPFIIIDMVMLTSILRI